MASEFLISGDPGQPIIETIAPDEKMFAFEAPPEARLAHYFDCGRSALRCVRLALAAADQSNVRRILDLPCGHGRVLRMLKAAFPEAECHACDLLTAGVEFCAKVLGAVPIQSDPDPAKVKLQGPYDLIWVGSLFTHFDAPRWGPFLKMLHNSLGVGGVCVFTAHGRFAADLIRRGETSYGLSDAAAMLKLLARTGFAYQAYGNDDYGISLSNADWVIKQIASIEGTQLAIATERGWIGHQDVFAWQKVSE